MIEVNLPEGDGAPDVWDESMKYDPMELLEMRNFIEKILLKNPNIKYGGSAGVGIDGADIDILIDDERWNIRMQPRKVISEASARKQ